MGFKENRYKAYIKRIASLMAEGIKKCASFVAEPIKRYPLRFAVGAFLLCVLVAGISVTNMILEKQRENMDRKTNEEVASLYTRVNPVVNEDPGIKNTPEVTQTPKPIWTPEITPTPVTPEETSVPVGTEETDTVPETGEGEADRQEEQHDAGESWQEEQEEEEYPWYNLISVDFDGLKAINPDIVGWLFFENGEGISYPILFSGDDKYLYTNYKGEKSNAGSIYLEGVNDPGMNNAHSLIYGHNMKNGDMFGNLLKFDYIKNYAEDHRFFQIVTEDRVYRYEIFAFRHTTPDEGGMFTVFKSQGKAFRNFAKETLGYVPGSIPDGLPETPDNIVSLVTCYYSSAARFVVSAVRVDEHLFDK